MNFVWSALLVQLEPEPPASDVTRNSGNGLPIDTPSPVVVTLTAMIVRSGARYRISRPSLRQSGSTPPAIETGTRCSLSRVRLPSWINRASTTSDAPLRSITNASQLPSGDGVGCLTILDP